MKFQHRNVGRCAAILGAGRIAGGTFIKSDEKRKINTHAAGMLVNDISIVAIYDPDRSRAELFSEVWGGEVHYSIDSILNVPPCLDIVVVCSPDKFHAEQVMQVLSARFPPRVLIIEKPPAVNSNQWRLVEDITRSQSRTEVIVNMTRRFDPRYAEVAQIINSGNLGALVSIDFTYYGGWLHNGVHAVDVVHYLFDQKLRVISANGLSHDHEGDQYLRVDAVFEDCRDAQIRFRCFDESYFQCFELDAKFTQGRIRLDNFGSRISVEKAYINDIGERELQPLKDLDYDLCHSPMRRLYAASCDFLDNNASTALSRASLTEIDKTMRVVFDAIQQSKSR